LNTDATKPGLFKIRRQTDQGSEMFEANVPLVITVTNNEHNVPRIAKTRDVMQAFRQPLTSWSLADIGLDRQSLDDCFTCTEVVELTIPTKQSHFELVTGETREERIAGLAHRIVAIVQSA